MINTEISLLRRLDRGDIDSIVATESEDMVRVSGAYSPAVFYTEDFLIATMDADTLEAFKKVMDVFTYRFEQGFPVVKIGYNPTDKTFSLEKSYLRNAVSTAALPVLPAGFPVTVRFEFSGFVVNEVVEVTALYGQAFSNGEVNKLVKAGVILSGNGTEFTIENSRECKVYFSKPDGVEGQYIIQYPEPELIIPVGDGL